MVTADDTVVGALQGGGPRTYRDLTAAERALFDAQASAYRAAIALVAQVSADLETGRMTGQRTQQHTPQQVTDWQVARERWGVLRRQSATARRWRLAGGMP